MRTRQSQGNQPRASEFCATEPVWRHIGVNTQPGETREIAGINNLKVRESDLNAGRATKGFGRFFYCVEGLSRCTVSHHVYVQIQVFAVQFLNK